MICQRCGKWAGVHATLPGQPTDHLCMCFPSGVAATPAPTFADQAKDAGWDKDGGSMPEDMTMRDHFAAKAMQTLITLCANDDHSDCVSFVDYVAMHSYKMADAMLKARGEVS